MNGEYVLNWLIEDADRNANEIYPDIWEGFDLAPIRRALNSCVNIFNLYGCF